MACQYQAVRSTSIWRFSMLRKVKRPVIAAMIPARPAMRWMAWA